MIFKLRMICDENDGFFRDYQLPYDMTLLDFHRFICSDLNYDAMNMSSFFCSNERWEQLQEFTLMDMGNGREPGAPIPMEQVALGQILRKNHDRLIYVFDQLHDRGLFLELIGTVVSELGTDYPRVDQKAGEPPLQFDESSAREGLNSLFDEAMDDFFDVQGDDFYEDDF
ncbi:MAG: hypothetical protein LUD68_00085 [Rikenellaceae bacterium]|nr:hypothetical protein [Rikenellaceae bacterium]